MDTSTFLKRSLIFQAELQRNSFPNASTLAELCGCSRSTAVRTIDRLRYEFGVPLEYDESHRGYYLTKSDFSFASLPPGRDELVVMILLGELLTLIDDASLGNAVSSLWAHLTNGRSDVHYDLEHIKGRFSSETTSVAKLADVDLLRLLDLSHKGQPVKVRYRSPWRHEEDKEYLGLFERFHFSDGILYAMFADSRGRHIVFNVSFIKDIAELDSLPPRALDAHTAPHGKDHWLEGFGVWSGTEPLTVEVAILAPASRYYAAQTWHPEQEDTWEGDTLVRRFPGIPSPELNRRILSLGRFVRSVKPESILKGLAEDAEHLSSLCTKG
jgi:predicted DNA-binding transcriptional regulator YafY